MHTFRGGENITTFSFADYLKYSVATDECVHNKGQNREWKHGSGLTWPKIFSLIFLQLITMITDPDSPENLGHYRNSRTLPRWQRWWIGGCRSLWQWLEWRSEAERGGASQIEVFNLKKKDEQSFASGEFGDVGEHMRLEGSSRRFSDPLSSTDLRVLLKCPKLCTPKTHNRMLLCYL